MAENRAILELTNRLVARLRRLANPERAKQVSKYMGGVGEYRGISAPALRTLSRQFLKGELRDLPPETRKSVAFCLMDSRYHCDRFCGVLLLGASPKTILQGDVERLLGYFRRGEFEGWALCDHVCSSVFRGLARGSREQTEAIARLGRQDNEWLKRVSNVAFVNLARFGDSGPNFEGFTDLMFDNCARTVQSQFRFTQLGCGWLLRELSLADRQRVVAFIRGNLEAISSEGLRYAVEKMPDDLKKQLAKEKKLLRKEH